MPDMPDQPRPHKRQSTTQSGNERMTTHRTRAQERIEQLDTSPGKLVEEIERLKADLAAAQAAANDNLATLQRTAADFANYRRRTAEERERDAGLASEYLLLKV